MFTVQFIELPAGLQEQSTKSVLVKFSIFLHKFGGAALTWLQGSQNNRVIARSSPAGPTTQSCETSPSWRDRNSL
jgi:hypothetical protein